MSLVEHHLLRTRRDLVRCIDATVRLWNLPTALDPSYARVIILLTNQDLLDELKSKKGTPEFMQALKVEAKKRGLRIPR